MNNEDVALLVDATIKISLLLLFIFDKKIVRYFFRKYPNSIVLKILLSNDVGKWHYYFLLISGFLLTLLLSVFLQIHYLILIIIAYSIVLTLMVLYYKRNGIYSLDDVEL